MIATWTVPARMRRAPTALPCAAMLGAVVPCHPLGAPWLAAALLAHGAVPLRWPNAWLLMLPAALPVLAWRPGPNASTPTNSTHCWPSPGLVLAWRGPAATAQAAIGSVARGWLALFCLSTVAALAIGAWPFHAPDLNSFNHYYGAWNGARLAKGLGWALLLWPAVGAPLARDVVKTQRRFALGTGVGLAGAALAVMWGRAAFSGLLNFDSGYRVVGLFSAMHTSGACIEAYFALSLPLVAWRTLGSRRWPQRLAGLAMLLAGSYALLVTYARGGLARRRCDGQIVGLQRGRRGRTAAQRPLRRWHGPLVFYQRQHLP